MSFEQHSEAKLDYYFDSYSHYGIHEEMLKDEARTLSYRNAIFRNRHLFEGKVVLDVGCGTGILSMFAAQAGASLVIGVDMSEMALRAQEIVRENSLESKVTILRGKMEEVVLPVDKVDIIISEWMGYCLLYEAMLDTVLLARDRYLKPDGLLFPDRATIYLAAIEDEEYKQQKVHWWDDVYGFDMSVMKKFVLQEPLVDVVEEKSIATDSSAILELDLYTCTKQDLAFSSSFTLRAARDERVHALLAWFTVDFDCRAQAKKPITLTTGPQVKGTHWKQSVFYLPKDLDCRANDSIAGTFACAPNARNPRELDFKIDCRQERDGVVLSEASYRYHMA